MDGKPGEGYIDFDGRKNCKSLIEHTFTWERPPPEVTGSNLIAAANKRRACKELGPFDLGRLASG